jgi:uncharacterized protein
MSSSTASEDRGERARRQRGDAALLAALARPSTYRGEDPVVVHETHASWVFVSGTRAYKVKKPVALGFLDYRTLARRHAACAEEVRVNGELAPDVYLGVCAIVRSGEGFELAREHDPDAVEYAVEMRSFDEADSLAGLIAAGALRNAQIDAVARRLVEFHRAAPIVAGGAPDVVLEMWRRNLRELAAAARPRWRVDAAVAFGEAFVRAHRDEIERRARDGLVRDGHGDLRCEHVLVRPRLRVVDRIEFDPSLRHCDVACDLAFLTMDLEALGRRDAAERLGRSYRAHGLDPGSEPLLRFYAAYRALVRAKVELIAAAEREGTRRDAALARARRLWELGERLAWRARQPVAILVCGPAATGKSTLAQELARRSGYTLISSDAVRRAAAGLSAGEHGGPELYRPAVNRATYERLGREAERLLGDGGGVVLDATCRSRADRAPLLERLRAITAPMLAVLCTVPVTLARQRAKRRLTDPLRASDATPAIVAEQFESFQALTELDRETVLELDTRASLPSQLERVAAGLDGPPAGELARGRRRRRRGAEPRASRARERRDGR